MKNKSVFPQQRVVIQLNLSVVKEMSSGMAVKHHERKTRNTKSTKVRRNARRRGMKKIAALNLEWNQIKGLKQSQGKVLLSVLQNKHTFAIDHKLYCHLP